MATLIRNCTLSLVFVQFALFVSTAHATPYVVLEGPGDPRVFSYPTLGDVASDTNFSFLGNGDSTLSALAYDGNLFYTLESPGDPRVFSYPTIQDVANDTNFTLVGSNRDANLTGLAYDRNNNQFIAYQNGPGNYWSYPTINDVANDTNFAFLGSGFGAWKDITQDGDTWVGLDDFARVFTYPTLGDLIADTNFTQVAGTGADVTLDSIAAIDPPPPTAGGFVASPGGTTEWRFNGITAGEVDKAFGPGSMFQENSPADQLSTTTAETSVPDIDGEAAEILLDNTVATAGVGYRVQSGVAGDGAGHTEFTMLWDMFIDGENNDPFLGMYQGNNAGGNDADFFLRPSTLGYYNGAGSVGPATWVNGQWNRFAARVDWNAGDMDIFVNGAPALLNTSPADFVFSSIDNPGSPNFWIFNDDNGEDSTSAVSAFAFVPSLISDAEIATLGAPNAAGIFNVGLVALVPEPSTLSLLILGLGTAVAIRRRRRARE